MANSTTVQVLGDGERNFEVLVQGTLDSSDLAATTVVDPAALAALVATGLPPAQLRVDDIQYSIEPGLTVQLQWDATASVVFMNLQGSAEQYFARYGGLQNNAGAGKTGKITMVTQGWTAGAILHFSFTLKGVKQ
jgi:hypothetical protein